MGWNGTCGISQLPITSGTRVKTILMLQSEFAKGIGGAGTCYCSAYFRPWFFAVTAEYNDYGSIENIQEDWNTKYMLETFQKWLAEGEVKILDNDECEINSPNIKTFKKLDDVFDCVERGSLVVKNPGDSFNSKEQKWEPTGGYLKIGMFMVLETVFDDMVKATNRFLNLKENAYYKKYDDEPRREAIIAINKARAHKNDDNIKDEELRGMLRDLHVDRLLGDLIEEHAAFKHYKDLLYNPDIITVDEFFAKLDEVSALSSAMCYLRKLWFPQTGQGSQNEELLFNKALIEAMSEHIGHRDAEFHRQAIESAKWEKEYKAEAAKKKAAKKKKVTA